MKPNWKSRLILSGAVLLFLVATQAPAQTPISGQPVASMSAVDTVVLNLMSRWQIPGAAVGITKDGRLVFARGYGYADTGALQTVQPDSLFRIASITKPFTAAAILKLIEQGRMSLGSTAFSFLPGLTPPAGATVDSRIYSITIQNLLEHKGGWDRAIAGDPPFQYPVTAATAFGAQPPATPDLLIRYMMGKPLQYNPGTTYAYSNFGYIVLGAIIERVSGQTYADFVSTYILSPAGIHRMRPGASLLSGRATDEVMYYDYPGAPLSGSVFPPVGSPVPAPYGGFSTELMLANGGWIASTIDLLRFADNINGQLTPGILNSPPSGFVGYVPPVGNGWGWVFDGSLPGTSTILHLDTGYQINGRVTYSVLFNTRNGGSPSPDIIADTDSQLLQTMNGIQSWPSNDLFPIYSNAGSPVLNVTKTHSGSFTQGQTNASYNVMVSNAAGAGPTSGTVTVTETVPSGLTLASMTGTGWTCANNSCTRTDALAGGLSYPAIAVAVSVGVSAASTVTNQVNVSGGGSAGAVATDLTAILPLGTTALSDFNHDGQPDVIWQDPVSGLAQVWFLGGAQGTSAIGAATLTASNTWRIVGVGDFNRDGRPDVVWQDPVSGAAQVWFLGGAQGNVVTGAAVLSTSNSWRIRSIADFNGDGQPDCIWQDPASGQAQIWFMGGAQGATITGAVNLTASNTWRIAGTGDFNLDGRPDVIWQDPVSGAIQIWYLGGAQGNVVMNAVNLAGANTWRIASVGDFNGDGHPDVVLQDPVSGTSQVWFLSGAQGNTIAGTAPMSGVNAWRIAGPR